jgi:hypothetical protein
MAWAHGDGGRGKEYMQYFDAESNTRKTEKEMGR